MGAGVEIVLQSSKSFEDPHETPHIMHPITSTQLMVELGAKLCFGGGRPCSPCVSPSLG